MKDIEINGKILRCRRCGTRNRVRPHVRSEAPVCGKCGARLNRYPLLGSAYVTAIGLILLLLPVGACTAVAYRIANSFNGADFWMVFSPLAIIGLVFSLLAFYRYCSSHNLLNRFVISVYAVLAGTGFTVLCLGGAWLATRSAFDLPNAPNDLFRIKVGPLGLANEIGLPLGTASGKSLNLVHCLGFLLVAVVCLGVWLIGARLVLLNLANRWKYRIRKEDSKCAEPEVLP